PYAYYFARTVLMRHALAGHADSRYGHAVDFAADLDRFFARFRARGDAHGDFVRLRRILRRHGAVDGIQAEVIDAVFFRFELDDLEAFFEYFFRQLRPAQGPRSGIEKHVLADEALGASDRYLQGRRARLTRDIGNAHPIGADLLEPGCREIDHDI